VTSATDPNFARPAPPTPVARAAREALFAAIIALGVFGPLLAFRTTQDMQNRLIIETRWGLIAIVVLLVFAGRFLLSLWFARERPEARPALGARLAGLVPRGVRDIVRSGLPPAALVALFVYPMMIMSLTGGSGALKWIDNFGIQILIYVMLAWGLNIVVGLAGLLDLGYVAFYAVGAYAYALIATKVIPATFPGLGVWAFWICLPVAGILAAFWGVLLGFPVLRLRGDYLAIVTLAFGEIIRLVLINWTAFSNGYEGISTIPRPSFFGVPFNASDTGFAATFGLEFSPVYRTIFLYYVIVCLALLTAWVSNRLRKLPVGRAWEALREDEIACRSLGINTVNTKLTAFAIGAMFGGFAGSFFAARQGFISPESFTFMESAVILAIVVLGGMGSLIGTAIAAVAMIGGTELLRELDWLKVIFGRDFDPAQYRMLIFGLAMVAIMVWKPRGFVSTRMPTAFLKSRRAVSADHVKEGHG
jgi:branched-chain amino acid transport system permease protein